MKHSKVLSLTIFSLLLFCIPGSLVSAGIIHDHYEIHAGSSNGNTVLDISTSPLMPGWMLASFVDSDELKYSQDGGKFWIPTKMKPWAGVLHSWLHVALVPKQDGSGLPRFLVGVNSVSYGPQVGLFRSGDFGTSWSQQLFDIAALGCNTPDMFFEDLFVFPATPKFINAYIECFVDDPSGSTMISTTYSSQDHGITWNEDPGNFYYIAVSPVDNLHMYGLHYDGWYETTDGGEIWKNANFTNDMIYRLTIGPDGTLYGLWYYSAPDDLVFAGLSSQDNGIVWEDFELPLSCRNLDHIQLLPHPTITGLLLLRCNNLVFRSLDHGDSWSPVDAPAGKLLTTDYGHLGRFLGVSDCIVSSPSMCGGLWYSDDGGTTWYQLTSDFRTYPNQSLLPFVRK